MTLTLVLDAAIALLLVATIVACVLLHRRLGELRRAKGEFATLVATFAHATTRAEAGVAALREAGATAGRDLDDKLEAARALVDELSFVMEHGSRLAERLESGGRKRSGAGPSATEAAPSKPAGDERTVVERDLFKALRAARGG